MDIPLQGVFIGRHILTWPVNFLRSIPPNSGYYKRKENDDHTDIKHFLSTLGHRLPHLPYSEQRKCTYHNGYCYSYSLPPLQCWGRSEFDIFLMPFRMATYNHLRLQEGVLEI
jgi:hypothetical protein